MAELTIVTPTRRDIIAGPTMPGIIDYPNVLQRLTEQGLVSLYHNSGAFGFPRGAQTRTVGWIGDKDPTLRPSARDAAITIAPPFEQTLAGLLVRFWREHVDETVAWVMPMSHWSYELDFGSAGWMPQMLREIGLDPDVLRPRNNGSAIEFQPREQEMLQACARSLLTSLSVSDFAVTFPGKPVVCTVHHHKQLWWVTTDARLAKVLRLHPSSMWL
jgi:hypothetical protein